jgi:hypothetical protein
MKTHSQTETEELQALLADPETPYRTKARCALQLRAEELQRTIEACCDDPKKDHLVMAASSEKDRIRAALNSLYGIV